MMSARIVLLGLAFIGSPLLFGLARVAAQEPVNWRFGVVEAYEAPYSAREMGIGWTRVLFHWGQIQTTGPDAWTPALTDEQIEAEIAAGRQVVGLLIGIPDWARDEQGVPQGLWLEPGDEQNRWGQFVYEIVRRYEGRIDHWIIWNEPDIEAGAVAHTWEGDVDDFYQLQKVAYLAAKRANTESVIHLPAFTFWADEAQSREQYMSRLLQRIAQDPLAPDHNNYFDVATAHIYFQPDQVYELLSLFRSIMDRHGMDKPIWLVETNAPPIDDPAWPVPDWTFSVLQDEQAAFVPQALAAALAAGAERVSLYKMQDTAGDRAANPEPFGLVRNDGSRRRAFDSAVVAVRLLAGVDEVVRERWDGVGQFKFEQDDRTTTMLFARLADGQQAEVQAIAGTALWVNMWGEEETITAQDGRFLIDLPPALCTQSIGDYCMIGGTTYYLIQSKDGGPPPQSPPVMLPMPTRQPTLPPPTHTSTATATSSPAPSATETPALDLIVLETATRAPTRTVSIPQASPTPQATEVEVVQSLEGTAVPAPLRTEHQEPPDSGNALTVAGGLFVLLLLFGVGWTFLRGRS